MGYWWVDIKTAGKWQKKRIQTNKIAAGVILNNAIQKNQFLTIDEWGLMYQKSEPSGTKWWVIAIDGVRGMLLDVMTNEIMSWDYVAVTLQLSSF